jgi:hypothetical protein
MKHKYTLEIEYNDDPAYKPITVSLKQGTEEIEAYSGASLKNCLSNATKEILNRESEA